MKKNTQKSPLENVLTVGGGGLSVPKAQPLPLQSLAQGESLKPSSALAQQGQPATFTPHGVASSKNSRGDALTARPASNTVTSQHLVGTLNWVLTRLRNLGLIEFVLNNADGRYEVWLPVSTWREHETLLVLTESETK